MSDAADPKRKDFSRFLAIPTRWQDCDAYGHVNNVVYYSYFDTAVTEHLVREAGHKFQESPIFAVIVETRCQFRKEISFPDIVDAGIKVVRLGNSSERYEIGPFQAGDEEPAAFGHFVHVWVDRQDRHPKSVPQPIRDALQSLVVPDG